MPDLKVTAFVPANVVRGGGNFGMLLVVENTSANSIAQVATTAGECGWGEGEELGSIPAGEGRRATLNLKLKDSGDWVIPIWVGCDEDGAEGWKGVLTTGADSETDYGVKEVTIIGQQLTGEKAGWGSVNEIEMNLKELADVLDPATREQIHKGILVPMPVQLERRDSHLWQKHLNDMKRNDEPRPEPVSPTVNVTFNTQAQEPSPAPSQQDDIMAAAHDTNQRMALAGMIALGGIALISVAGFILLHFKKDDAPLLLPDDEKADEIEEIVDGSKLDDSTPPEEEERKAWSNRTKPESPPSPGPVPFQRVEAQVVQLSAEEGNLVTSSVPSTDERASLQLNEHYAVRVQLKSAGYLRVFSTQPDGRLWQVYPNALHASERFEQGEYFFPDPNKQDQEGNVNTIAATELTPIGRTERMLVQWSREPFEEQPFNYEGGAAFAFATRGTTFGSLRVKQSEEQEIEYTIKK